MDNNDNKLGNSGSNLNFSFNRINLNGNLNSINKDNYSNRTLDIDKNVNMEKNNRYNEYNKYGEYGGYTDNYKGGYTTEYNYKYDTNSKDDNEKHSNDSYFELGDLDAFLRAKNNPAKRDKAMERDMEKEINSALMERESNSENNSRNNDAKKNDKSNVIKEAEKLQKKIEDEKEKLRAEKAKLEKEKSSKIDMDDFIMSVTSGKNDVSDNVVDENKDADVKKAESEKTNAKSKFNILGKLSKPNKLSEEELKEALRLESEKERTKNTAFNLKKKKSFFSQYIEAYKKAKEREKERRRLEEESLKNSNADATQSKDIIKSKKAKTGEEINFSEYFNKDTMLFSVFIILILFVFVSVIIPSNKEVSALVKSNLTDVNDIDGKILKWETELENTIISKFPYYEQILKGYFGTIQNSNKNLYENANDNDLILLDNKNGIYIDKYKDQLIRKYEVDEINEEKEIRNRIKLFNAASEILKEKNVNLYVYAVSGIWTSEAILNFELDYKEPLKYVNMFKESIDSYINFDYLKIIDYTTFKEYFFATDHHWRIQGAYEGYKDLMKMFNIPDEEIVKPDFFKVEGVKFIGSNARLCAFDEVIDYLWDLEFDEDYEVEVNRKEVDEEDFTKKEEYLKGEFSDEEFYNHYASYFHSDLGEIVYTYDKNKKQNDSEDKRVLIIADSYSNCIDRIIASHFYKTYVIDLRYFKNSVGEEFVLSDYVEENEITDVVVMLSANSIYFESADLELGIDGVSGTKEED